MEKEARRKRKLGGGFPPPVVVPPLQLPHLHTIIILHGRGGNGETFRRPLLHHPIPEHDTLRKAFPQAKLVFPTSAYSRAKVFQRIPITQWFDYWPFKVQEADHEPEIEGLVASVTFIHALIQKAVDEVGAPNVVVGGLSQGCAAALISMLLWEGPKISSWFGMCGWLPFRQPMTTATAESENAENDVFDRPAQAQTVGKADRTKAVEWLREELGMANARSILNAGARQTSHLFLGHGSLDDKVPVTEGREAANLLSKLDCNVTWREYQELGHWYSGEILKDIVDFLHRHATVD